MSLDYNKLDQLISEATVTVDQEEVEKLRNYLVKYFKYKGFEGSITEHIDSVFERALKGWPRAAKDFETRVRTIVGNGNLKAYDRIVNDQKESVHEKKEIELVAKKEISDQPLGNVFDISYYDHLDGEEKKYWIKREKDYRKEFDFNESSDRTLLEEVLYNEVLLRRIRINKLTGDYADKVKGLNEKRLMDSIREAMDKLGILRVQRISLDKNIEGNVGELSLLLDEKLDEFKGLDTRLQKKSIKRMLDKYDKITFEEVEEILEEQNLLRQVEKMSALNPIPQAVYNQVISDIDGKDENSTS
jgi:hypothetical protein